MVSKLYTSVYVLKFTKHLCIYGPLYGTVASAGESTQGLLMFGFRERSETLGMAGLPE